MALPSGNENEIVWLITVKDKDATDRIQDFQKVIQSLKNEIRSLSKDTGTSFDTAFKSIKRDLQDKIDELEAVAKEIQQLQKFLSTNDVAKGQRVEFQGQEFNFDITKQDEFKARLDALKKSFPELSKQIDDATSRLNLFNQVGATSLKAVKQEEELVRKGLLDLSQAAASSASQTASIFTQTATSTQQFGTSVEELKAKLLEIQQVSGGSFQEIAASLGTQLSENARKAAEDVANLEEQIRRLKEVSSEVSVGAEIKPVDTTQLQQLQTDLELAKQKSRESATEFANFASVIETSLLELGTSSTVASTAVDTITASTANMANTVSSSFEKADVGSQEFRSSVESVKAALQEIQSQTGQSFVQIAESLGTKLADSAKQAAEDVRLLEEQIKQLQSTAQASTATAELTTGEVDVSGLQTLQNKLEDLKQVSAEANSAVDSFETNITTALQQVETSATTSANALANLFTQLQQGSRTALTGLFTEGASSIQNFDQLVEGLKQRMIELNQQTGQSFKSITVEMQKTFGEQGKKIISSYRDEIRQTQEKIKLLQQAIANPIAGTAGANQTAQYTKDLEAQTSSLDKLQKELLQTQQNIKIVNQAMGQAGAAASKAAGGTNIFSSALSSLNNVARLVFGVTLAGLAVQALRGLSGWFSEATDKAREFAKAFFQLEVGVRALRRSGIEITTSEVISNLQKINESVGNLYSNFQLVAGAAEFTNLIRDLGLTRDQIFTLQEAVVKLAVVNGRAMDDVQKTVALALSSGYTEGLQRLGVSINRLTIAEEAARLGWEGGYNALTEIQRSEATYNLIVQKTTKYLDDLSEAQKRVFGELQSTEAQIENTSVEIGQRLLPLQLAWNSSVLGLLNILSRLPGGLLGTINLLGGLVSIVKSLPAVWENAGDSAETFGKKILRVAEFITEMRNAILSLEPIEPIISKFAGFDTIGVEDNAFAENQAEISKLLEKNGTELENLTKETNEKRKRLEEDFQKDMKKIADDGVYDRLEIERKYQADLLKLDAEAALKRTKLFEDLQNKLADIGSRLDFDLGELDIKFDFDVNETLIKFNQDIANANEDFRRGEVERERKYQEELLRLREDYLLTLEDALEARDARAVLRARREYLLEKERAGRENELNKIKNKEGLDDDLRTAAERRDARLRELQFELEQRRAELQRQAEFDRAEAQRNYNRDLVELEAKLVREKEARDAAYAQEKIDQAYQESLKRIRRENQQREELKDLENHRKALVAEFAKILAEQAVLQGYSNEEMRKAIEAYFGQDGIILGIYESFVTALQALLDNLRFNPRQTDIDFGTIGVPSIGPQAQGGAAIASKPTSAIFGDAGPELALFLPLSKIDQLSGVFENGIGERAVQAGTEGQTRVVISLADGLVGEIVDAAMEENANVVIETIRARGGLS